jgi:predicted Zn-dependent protease
VRYRAWLDRWGLPGGNAAQALRELAALSYSETQELEADALALEMLKAADLRPAAGAEALGLIDAAPGGEAGRRDPAAILLEATLDYWRTHPGRRERLDRLASSVRAS